MTATQLRLTIHRGSGSDARRISFGEESVTVGRSDRCDVRLPFRVVSSHHLTFQGRHDGYAVRDEGSTNGTALDGTLMDAGQWRALEDGTILQIVDVVLEIELLDSRTAPEFDGFTLAQTGTLARELLGEALEEEDDDLAYLELLEGPKAGHRVELPDDAEDFAIEVWDSGPIATVSFRNDAFWLEPTDRVGLQCAGESVETQWRLSDGDPISAAGNRLVFRDPLASRLDELTEIDQLEGGDSEDRDVSVVDGVDEPDGEPPTGEEATSSENKRPGETPGRAASRSRGWIAGLLLASTALLIVAVVVILLVTFGVI